jgi:autotransporter-associated beta strand protein
LNWGGTLPGSADVALFSAASYVSQPSLTTTASVGGIWDTGSGAVTIGGTSALTLFGATINSNTGTGMEVDVGAGPLTINAPLVLPNNQQWINNSASALTVNGAVSGTGSLTILGSGLLTLSGLNTLAGNLTVDGGTLQMPNGSLASPTQYVGYSGTGTLLQSGGVNAIGGIGGQLYLGHTSISSGTYYLNGGSLSCENAEYVGYSGTGSFAQSGGAHSVSSNLYLGYNSASNGTYNLSNLNGASQLSASNEYIGYSGTGSFTQTGGTNSVTAGGEPGENIGLVLGSNRGSSGTYNLTGGSLFCGGPETGGSEIIGGLGTGNFAQSGGTNALFANASNLIIANYDGSNGTYNLTGSGLLSPQREFIGYEGTGSFTESGGTNSTANVILGSAAGSSPTYNLSGSGLLSSQVF